MSGNGLRQYRNPALKAKSVGISRIFESRSVARGRWNNNYHVNVRQ